MVKKPSFSRHFVRFRDIKDGSSKTIMAGESAYYLEQAQWPIWLGSPREDESTLFKTNTALNCNITSAAISRFHRMRLIGPRVTIVRLSWHVGGVQFVFCDGSVHFVQESIELQTYANLGDRMDGQVLDDLF